MKKAMLSILFICLNAFADSGLDQLKQSFSAERQNSTKEFDKAAAMKSVVLPFGNDISKNDCEALKARITPNYKINPFEFVFEGGSSVNYVCGGQYGWQKNHLLNKSGTTNLGLPYVAVLQLEGRDSDAYKTGVSLYFIDASYRIVEIQGQSIINQTKEVISYGITSVDQKGNLYESVYDKDYGIIGGLAQDVSGVHHMERYIPADGSSVYPMLRNTVKNTSDPSKDYQIMSWDRSDKRDWQDYQLPITLSDSGGYYGYGGKYYSTYGKPTFKSSITIKNRGGKEFCAYGDVKADQNWVSYPSDQKAYYDCLNY